MHIEHYRYNDEQTECVGYLAYDKTTISNQPVVLVFPDWSGCNEFAQEKARYLANLGYIGFAVDIYGQGRTGQTNDQKSALMTPFMEDRNKLKQRILAALNSILKHPLADKQKIAAMGFCFGGLCALDLARSGAQVQGVVSFHGLLNPPAYQNTIHAKVLALHGYDDPMAPPSQVLEFANEMKNAKADWQIHAFGNTMHAFTNPSANDPGFGTVYNAAADKRSFALLQLFLKELFS